MKKYNIREKQLSIRYYGAVIVIFVLSLFALFSTQYVLSQQEKYASIINKSGRQRMLSQQTTMLLLHLSTTAHFDLQHRQVLKENLQKSITLMEKSHKELTTGIAEDGAVFSLSPEINQMYFEKPLQVDKQVTNHIKEVRSILEQPELHVSAEFVGNVYAGLLTSLNEVVQQYEVESNSYSAILKKTEIIVCVTTLLILVVLVRFVFFPLVRSVIKNEETLISEQKETELFLTQAKEAAENASRMKSEFLASLSHELKTPMNAIIGLTYLTLETEITGKQRDYLNKISSSARHLVLLIDDLLDFSKINTTSITLKDAPFNMGDVMDNLASVITCIALEKGLEVNFNIELDVPFHLIGDQQRLEQLLGHLVSNAVKFTEEGHVDINTELLDKDDSRISLRFTVNDTGKGIAGKDVERMFLPFTQEENSSTRQHGGTGLGLAICKDLVDLMGGEIRFEQKSEAGALFVCELSFSYDELQSQSHPEIPELQGLKVLLVDDHPMARTTMKHMLASFHLDAKALGSAKEALIELESNHQNATPYDIVVTDWQMPEMDGVEFAGEIRQSSEKYGSPVMILVTAFSKAEAVQKAEEDFDGLLLKPVNRAVLLGTLLASQKQKGVARSSQSSVVRVRALPDRLPGLDLKKGTAQVGGNSKIYIWLLKKFARNQAGQIDVIRQENSRGNTEAFYRHLHTLKGVAGNIGAFKLYGLSMALEKDFSLVEGGGHGLLESKVGVLEEAMDEVLTSINSLVSDVPDVEEQARGHARGNLDSALLNPIIDQLDRLLADSDTDAENLLEQLAEYLQETDLHNKVSVLQEQIGQYEFDEALETVQDIRVTINT